MYLESGLESLKRGEFVLLFDSAGRENEIDMVVAAEFVTPEHVARMRQHAGGLLCIALDHNFATSLELLALCLYLLFQCKFDNDLQTMKKLDNHRKVLNP
jgi:3,4-dihydroxy 2-butanone 4-phosphate synthase